jgi:uncharacterized protein (UPF0332 family)
MIKWCLETNNGLEIIEPNSNLADAYLKEAESSLISMKQVEAKEWKISTSYYAMYFSLYAILMKIGIKCEIHKCTLEFMKVFLKKYFSENDIKLLKKSFTARNDVQYYTDRIVSDEFFVKMMKNTPLFLIRCKEIVNRMNESEIKTIRKRLEDNHSCKHL